MVSKSLKDRHGGPAAHEQRTPTPAAPVHPCLGLPRARVRERTLGKGRNPLRLGPSEDLERNKPVPPQVEAQVAEVESIPVDRHASELGRSGDAFQID
jgi:hypothetical protein